MIYDIQTGTRTDTGAEVILPRYLKGKNGLKGKNIFLAIQRYE